MAIDLSYFFASFPAKTRDEKGNSLIAFPQDYTVIDTETTGLEPLFDELIEFAALRIRGGQVVEQMQTFLRPSAPVDSYITQLTGITNEMLANAPLPKDILPQILEFCGEDILIGHNVNFDINFIYDAAESTIGETVKNDFIDTMRLARRLLPELAHHRLKDLSEFFCIPQTVNHRAIADCKATLVCFERLKEKAVEKYGSLDAYITEVNLAKHKWNHLERLTTDKTEFDTSHPLYGKHCVFTGALERMPRLQAAQIVVDLGGYADNGITKKTNYLILGNNDYCKTIKDGKSSKQKKAEQYKLEGYDIEIIPESVFYEMIASK